MTSREHLNLIRYQTGPFADHRGVLIGTPLEPGSESAEAVPPQQRGQLLWDIDTDVTGWLRRLHGEEAAAAASAVGEKEQGERKPTHAVTWSTFDGAGDRQETVHLLTEEEKDDVLARSTGTLIDIAAAEVLGIKEMRDHPAVQRLGRHYRKGPAGEAGPFVKPDGVRMDSDSDLHAWLRGRPSGIRLWEGGSSWSETSCA